MKLVVVRFRDVNSRWFVSEKDERLSGLLDQPMPETGADSVLASWPTRGEACAYATVVARLLAKHPERSRTEVRLRAYEIVRHG